MSLVLTALLVAGGAMTFGAIGRAARRRRARSPERVESAPRSSKRTRAPAKLMASGFSVEAGDVISVAGEELWLEHAWLLSEGGDAVAAVLFADEATVVAVPAPRSALYRLERVALEVPLEAPSSLDSRGVRFERAIRRPVRVEPFPGAPDPPFVDGVLAEYRALGGESLWLVAHAQSVLAWQGRRVQDGDLERWGKG